MQKQDYYTRLVEDLVRGLLDQASDGTIEQLWTDHQAAIVARLSPLGTDELAAIGRLNQDKTLNGLIHRRPDTPEQRPKSLFFATAVVVIELHKRLSAPARQRTMQGLRTASESIPPIAPAIFPSEPTLVRSDPGAETRAVRASADPLAASKQKIKRPLTLFVDAQTPQEYGHALLILSYWLIAAAVLAVIAYLCGSLATRLITLFGVGAGSALSLVCVTIVVGLGWLGWRSYTQK